MPKPSEHDVPDRPECAGHRATLYSFLRETILPMLREDGVWVAPDPAPLNADEVEAIFEQIAALRAYERQHLTTCTEDGYAVELQNGLVRKELLA